MATEFQVIPKIFITPMRYEDVPSIAVVERQCFSTPWSENAYRTELSNQCAEYYVAWMGGNLAGYVGMWLIMDEVHITTLGVAPEYRGKKVGERLLTRVLDAARERGAQRVTLEVRKSNETARSLYNKYGFREAAIRKGYYSDNDEDAVIMWIDDMWTTQFTTMFNRNKTALENLERP
ncbi:MAG: ribosomal protein S18-alanine N-acetyltransferase [Armatimonadota bacterium]